MKKLITSIMILSQASLMAAPQVDIAIALDTSGSMQGLITQVRDGLWQTLNNLGEIKKDGEVASLRLALYEYGSGVVGKDQDYLQLLVPLTTDHTQIASKLFATQATGSQEYIGAVVEKALSDLDWSKEGEDFKAIVVAGNETIKQGEAEPMNAASKSLGQDILLNTIFCGPEMITPFSGGFGHFGGGFGGGFEDPATKTADPVVNPIFLEWKELANLGGGQNLSIDQNDVIPYIPSPYDTQIVDLTKSLSSTYLPFGTDGATKYQDYLALDSKVMGSGAGSYMDWGGYVSGNFGTATIATWELVEAAKNTDFDLSKLSEAELPDALKGKSLGEKLDLIKAAADKREQINKEIEALKELRRTFIAEELKKLNTSGKDTFADAFRKMITKQLQDQGFQLN
jgi:hypothetical protein